MQLVSTKSTYSITNKGCEAWLIQKGMKQFLSGTIDNLGQTEKNCADQNVCRVTETDVMFSKLVAMQSIPQGLLLPCRKRHTSTFRSWTRLVHLPAYLIVRAYQELKLRTVQWLRKSPVDIHCYRSCQQ